MYVPPSNAPPHVNEPVWVTPASRAFGSPSIVPKMDGHTPKGVWNGGYSHPRKEAFVKTLQLEQSDFGPAPAYAL